MKNAKSAKAQKSISTRQPKAKTTQWNEGCCVGTQQGARQTHWRGMNDRSTTTTNPTNQPTSSTTIHQNKTNYHTIIILPSGKCHANPQTQSCSILSCLHLCLVCLPVCLGEGVGSGSTNHATAWLGEMLLLLWGLQRKMSGCSVPSHAKIGKLVPACLTISPKAHIPCHTLPHSPCFALMSMPKVHVHGMGMPHIGSNVSSPTNKPVPTS